MCVWGGGGVGRWGFLILFIYLFIIFLYDTWLFSYCLIIIMHLYVVFAVFRTISEEATSLTFRLAHLGDIHDPSARKTWKNPGDVPTMQLVRRTSPSRLMLLHQSNLNVRCLPPACRHILPPRVSLPPNLRFRPGHFLQCATCLTK